MHFTVLQLRRKRYTQYNYTVSESGKYVVSIQLS